MRRLRPLSWVILGWNALMLVWLVSGLASTADNCADEFGSAREACEAGTAVGAGIGIAFILFIAALGNVILGVIWLVTKKSKRTCPVCGVEVRPGITRCPSCSYDFRVAAGNAVPPEQRVAGACTACGAPPVKPRTPQCTRCGAEMPVST